MKKETVLVVGASGTVGSELVKLLKADGFHVRATTSKKTTSPEQVHINVATGEGLKEAFTGVDKAFLLSPPGFADQYKILSPMIQEAKRQGLKKVILMTALGANAVDTAPMRMAEIELEKSGLTYNIVRPNWFFQNFNTFWVQGIRQQGKILLPAGEAGTSFIDAKDISAVVAKLLATSNFDNKDFDLTGPDSLTHAQIAKGISEVAGKSVTYQDVDPSDLKKNLLSVGLPADYADFMLLIFGFLKAGYNSRLSESVKQIIGREPRSFNDYLKDNKSAWV